MAPPDHRPGYHLAPASGWINDPNGPIEWDGRYHLFFQRNPLAAAWAPEIRWGHAVSEDLCRWTVLPDAFGPSEHGPDAGGCWSGCVVDDDGTPTAVYSGRAAGADAAETVCLARGDAALETWRKDPRNPVIAGPPEGAGLTAFRDPFVWLEDGRWRMMIGAGMPDGGGAVIAYRSDDLVGWEADGVLLRAADAPMVGGAVWECPQYFRLGDRWVLLLSVWNDGPAHAVALIGDEVGGRFEVETATRFDHGADCYAPATMADGRGRRLAWAWSWEGRPAQGQDWAGVLTLPRVLELADDGTLAISPVPELTSLRGEHEEVRDVALNQPFLACTRGDQVEIEATIDPGTAESVSLRVRRSPDGEEETVIALDPRGGPLNLAPDEPLELHAFVDRSIVEVYANDRLTITQRTYPAREDSTGFALGAANGEARIEQLGVWTLLGGQITG